MAEQNETGNQVVLGILDSWPRLGKLLLAVLCVVAIGCVAAYLVVRFLPSTASELQIGSSHILFRQPTKDGVNSVVVVSPQSWNRTSIAVREGENLQIEAGGKVYVDLESLNRALVARQAAEERVAKTVNAAPGTYVPEDYFTAEEKLAMMPPWHWTNPDGVPESEMRARANPKRRARSILPNAGCGVLVGAFNERDADPAGDPGLAHELAAAAFRVGSSYANRASAKGSGYLYFTVNDVQYDAMPDLFFMDNIGSYYVKVLVTSK